MICIMSGTESLALFSEIGALKLAAYLQAAGVIMIEDVDAFA